MQIYFIKNHFFFPTAKFLQPKTNSVVEYEANYNGATI